MSKLLNCSFCDKTQAQVSELLQADIEGKTDVRICNECVGQCVAMLAQIARRNRENQKPVFRIQKG